MQILKKKEYSHFFENSNEKNLIKHGSKIILLPEVLVGYTEIDEQGFEFANDCKKKNFNILILSNWDPYSFELLNKKFSNLFNLFEESNIFIPAKIGYLKPEAQAFEYIAKNMNLELNETFFIDDGAANTEAAKALGINSIHHASWQNTKNIFNKIISRT